MEPTTSLKRKAPHLGTVISRCLFCQSSEKQGIRCGKIDSISRVQEVLALRKKYEDNANIDLLERLDDISDWSQTFLWHKNCYSAFTAASKIERLKHHHDNRSMSSVKNEEETTERPRSRSSISSIDWASCIFCQATDRTSDLRNVATFNTSKRILTEAQQDVQLRVRLAGVNDLMAAEGKYHLRCYADFMRKAEKVKKEGKSNDRSFNKLVQEMKVTLSRGNVYGMDVVWRRYLDIAELFGDEPQQKYVSRKASFKDDLSKALGETVDFVRPLDQRKPLIIFPTAYSKNAILKLSSAVEEEEDDDFRKSFQPDHENEFVKSLFYVMKKIRQDMKESPGHQSWNGIDEDHVKAVIPESLFLMIRLLFEGDAILDEEDILKENKTKKVRKWIYSIAQDLVYGVSGGKKLTPKHIGLGMTFHQATRSKQLVDLLHESCHSISYDMVRRIDTSISQHVLEKFVENDNVFIPRGILPGRFAHFSADNVDILEETLDGRNTFHATQMAVWQRGPVHEDYQEMLPIGKEKRLKSHILEEIHKIEPIHVPKTKTEPSFQGRTPQYEDTFERNTDTMSDSRAKDIAWLISRVGNGGSQHVPGWSGFNRSTSHVSPEVTTAGFLPIIQQPAHEYDTLNTVLIRCMDISRSIRQSHTVITIDQALYCKVKELVWLKEEAFKTVVVKLGGLHILMNYLQCIGKHMDSAGLEDTLLESGLYGENTIQSLLAGKAYNRAVRAHKLTYEALWRVYWTSFQKWLTENDKMLNPEVIVLAKAVSDAFKTRDKDSATNAVFKLVEKVKPIQEFQEYEVTNVNNPTFMFWRRYMKMVETLLNFIRAERDGNWELHLTSFAAMLPFFTLYDHINYARWGPVYLTDMSLLSETAPDVYREFAAGNFVVKRSEDVFNQVSADQALEWLNRSCKVAGGLIGITRNESARDKWCLTYNEKSYIAECTRAMVGIVDDEEAAPTRNDSLPSGIQRDEHDVQLLVHQFERFNVFKATTELRCITTNDIAPEAVKDDLLQAEERGQLLVKHFVEDRLINRKVSLYSPNRRNNSQTFGSIAAVTVQKKDGCKVIKADRNLFRRLLVATDAGRKVDLSSVLEHELSQVPLSLAEIGGNLRSTTKSCLSDILQANINIRVSLPENDKKTCLLIDGPALIQAIGKPSEAKSFGDLADVFCDRVIGKLGSTYKRIDVIFDRYEDYSIKNAARLKRSGKTRRPIRKVIDSRDVPLPHIWKNFMDLSSNKTNLANFLASQLVERMKHLPEECELVTAGGLSDATSVVSSNERDVSSLMANHEEADTRLVLHAKDARSQDFERTVVECSDTDVMVLIVHFKHMLTDEVWFKKGNKYIPLHEIDIPSTMRENIVAFHALTGCDTTSSFSGIGKKSAWKVFCKNPELLNGVGHGDMDAQVSESVEMFVCRLYGCECSLVNEARRMLFLRAKKAPEGLPPTHDALQYHIRRVHHQTTVWTQAVVTTQEVPDPVDSGGWRKDDSKTCLVPVLMSKEPVPAICLEIITCGCRTKCSTARCKCYMKGLICTGACGCGAEECNNPTAE